VVKAYLYDKNIAKLNDLKGTRSFRTLQRLIDRLKECGILQEPEKNFGLRQRQIFGEGLKKTFEWFIEQEKSN